MRMMGLSGAIVSGALQNAYRQRMNFPDRRAPSFTPFQNPEMPGNQPSRRPCRKVATRNTGRRFSMSHALLPTMRQYEYFIHIQCLHNLFAYLQSSALVFACHSLPSVACTYIW